MEIDLYATMRVLGFAFGFILPAVLAWLVFIYPYSDASLRPWFKWLLYGLAAGFIALAGFAMWIGSKWQQD